MTNTLEKLLLDRIKTSDDGTFGQIIRNGHQIAATCELPWNDNIPRQSCIPKGVYLCTLGTSPSKNKQVDYQVYKVNEVTGRSEILIHIANWPHELLGCIGVGRNITELKGKPAIDHSTDTMKELLQSLPRSFYLQVTGVCG